MVVRVILGGRGRRGSRRVVASEQVGWGAVVETAKQPLLICRKRVCDRDCLHPILL